jgi:hypothetical protein
MTKEEQEQVNTVIRKMRNVIKFRRASFPDAELAMIAISQFSDDQAKLFIAEIMPDWKECLSVGLILFEGILWDSFERMMNDLSLSNEAKLNSYKTMFNNLVTFKLQPETLSLKSLQK